MFSNLTVNGLSWADRHKRKFDAILSIHDPRSSGRVRFHKPPYPDRETLFFHDVESDEADGIDDLVRPSLDAVKTGLDFAARVTGRLLVHCEAGKCRSGAMGYILNALMLGEGREGDALDALLRQRPEAVPNTDMVIFGDELLGRRCRLLATYKARLAARPDWHEHKRRHAQGWKTGLDAIP